MTAARPARYQNEVEVGMVGINVPVPVPVGYYSFGGWKASLFGDTHAHGTEGFSFYTRNKVITTRWLDPVTAGSTSASHKTNERRLPRRRDIQPLGVTVVGCQLRIT
jgi:hypothetical protein